MKIKFLTNGGHEKWSVISINPSYFMLKNYYEFRGKYPVEWLDWEPVIIDEKELQLQRILDDKPDVLALGFYVWNQKRQFYIAEQVKKHLPNTVIVAGGPQLTAHKNKEFFNQYPYIDYVCYGDGERAFTLLIHKLHGEDCGLVNMVENCKGEYILHPYEFFLDEEFFVLPTYTLQKPLVEKTINDLVEFGINKKSIEFGVEFARGCMYKCSFCDWSQNLTKKVKRRSFNWQEEMDYFKQLDVACYSTDANFGQWKEDFEIFDYALSLYDPNGNFKFYTNNTPKLKKEAIYYISLKQAEYYNYPVVLNLQCIYPDTLEMIDRPSIPYADMVDLIKRFKQALPVEKHNLITGQTIIGMPGQNFRKISDMFRQLILDGIHPTLLWTNMWIYLENAPAADPEYQKLHGLEWWDTYTFLRHNELLNDGVEELLKQPLEEIYTMIARGEFHPSLSNLRLIKKTKYMDFKQLLKGKQLARLVRNYATKNLIVDEQYQDPDFLNPLFEKFDQQCEEDINRYFEQNQPLIDKYGFAVLVWKNGNKVELLTY